MIFDHNLTLYCCSRSLLDLCSQLLAQCEEPKQKCYCSVGAYRWSSGPHDHKIIAGKVKYQHDTIPETRFFCNTKVCCFFSTGVAGISVADCVYRHWKQLLYSFSIVAVNHSRSNESQEVFLCFIWCSGCDYIRVNTTNLTVTVAFFGRCPLISQRLLKYVCALKLTMASNWSKYCCWPRMIL